MEVTLRHLPAQADFFECPDRQAAFVGGLGYGKTFVAADWILAGMAEYPRAEHYIFSNTYTQLRDGTLRTFFEQCDAWGLKYVDRLHLHKTIEIPELGSVVHVRSADKPINFKSLEICRAWIDEAQAYKLDTYNKILGRRRGSALQRQLYPDMPLQIRLTANPPHSMQHWLYKACVIPDIKTGKPPITYFTAATWDNPYLPQDYIDDLFAHYDADLAEIEMGGKFGNIGTGKVWRAFDRGLHVLSPDRAAMRGLPPLEYDPTIPLCWAQDFNIDPLSGILFQWRAVNVVGYRRQVMYVLDELRIRHSMIQHAVREFVENRPDAMRVARTAGLILYGDPAGNQGNRQTGESDWAALKQGLAQNGLVGEVRVPASPPRILNRYAAGNAMLVNAHGEIGVVIHERCRFLGLDLEAMEYKIGTRLVDAKKKLEDGATATHLGDAWSYAIDFEHPVHLHDQELPTNAFAMR